MKTHWTEIVGAAVLAAPLLAFAPALAAEADYNTWDANNNAGIEMNEFNSNFDSKGIYGDWDANKDGMLSESEFNNGVFSSYDKNNNSIIEESEFGDLNDDLGEDGVFDV